MAWMKTTSSCPLCKRDVGVIIADIQSPSEYSQYLPNGKFLYSSYSPRRKTMLLLWSSIWFNSYSLGLVPLPNYEGVIPSHSVKKCPILKEWIQREIDVVMYIIVDIQTLLPGSDRDFFVTLILEGVDRYGSRHDYVRMKMMDLLRGNVDIFIREMEGCFNCHAVQLLLVFEL